MFPSKPFINFEWNKNTNSELLELVDGNKRVICKTSIGPYKNIFGDIKLDLGNIYYWEI